MLFGLPLSVNDTLFPHSECDHCNRIFWKHTLDLGHIRFSAGFIAQMRAPDVDTALFQQGERLRTVSMNQHQLYPGRLHVAAEHRDARVASRDQDEIAKSLSG
jgi:hypothetical protein